MKGSDNTMTINFIQYVDADDEGEGEDDADHKMGNKKEIKEEISIDRFMREYWVVLKRIYEKIDKTDNINTPEN